MPTYPYSCACGQQFDRYWAVRDYQPTAPCCCGQQATRRFTAPLLVKASVDVCYDSPIDGTPITSHAQRREDMRKHGCIEYDPEMKTDCVRKMQEQEAAIDRSIDQQVEHAVERMPTAQRAKLYSEVTEQGLDLTYHRATQGA